MGKFLQLSTVAATYLKVYIIPDWEEQSKNNREDHLDVRPGGETKNTENQQLNKLEIESKGQVENY